MQTDVFIQLHITIARTIFSHKYKRTQFYVFRENNKIYYIILFNYARVCLNFASQKQDMAAGHDRTGLN